MSLDNKNYKITKRKKILKLINRLDIIMYANKPTIFSHHKYFLHILFRN